MLQVFQDFAAYLQSSERSPLTIKHYLADLGHFVQWFVATNDYPAFQPADVTPTDLREFKQFLLLQQESQPASVNRRLAALRSFLKWAGANGLAAPLSPATFPKFEKTPPTGIRWLTRQEENALLRAVARNGNPRDQAIITLLLHTGLRVSELCAVRWQEVVINERKGSLTVLRGKGGTRRDLPLNYEARQVLLALGYQAQAGRKEAVFVGQRGPLTPRGVQALVGKYAMAARLTQVSPHSLRHTFCKNLLNAGVSLEKIALLAGHESLDTTRLYLEPSFQDLAQAVAVLCEER